MSVYAKVGDSQQQVDGECPPGWLLMKAQRPELYYVAGSDGEWHAPHVAVPAAVSRFQGRQALRLSTMEDGRIVINDTSGPSPAKRDLLAAVDELLAAPTTPAYYRDAWNDIQQFERDSPMLLAIADELGLAAANLDDLFILAATLRA
ncbi:hypothetical protein [Achromobacter xylosoxidans]|uniref:Uncharacterized protein n=1 Tax=Alcaligenes xylosoxydans xylosoxydans TaxID=85698 RepID=A0A0X8P521_ALCXX|nr:hypothetical protein [Achromobacter xylosoxidans]AMG39988.1 hypothetical protein AL504_30765 [Achromobacter xylosoxidans]